MKKSPAAAFTLLEMLTVLAIIVVLAGLVLSVGGYVQKKAALSRTEGELHMLISACESYKGDNGSPPRDTPSSGTSVTDTLSPKQHFIPTDTKYSDASLFLYKELSGDKKGTSGTKPDGIPDDGEQRYMKEYDLRILNATKDPTTKKITEVKYLQDPFGFPYAYSTAAAKDEEDFQKKLKLNPTSRGSITRPSGSKLNGFNPGSYDLWSTGGSTKLESGGSAATWPRWIKNW